MKRWLMTALYCVFILGAQSQANNATIRLITPYPPGGAADQLARVIANEMKTRFDQTVIVDNRPGAGAQVAMNVVMHSNTSGGPVLFLADSNTYSANQYLYKKLNYNVNTDLIPLTLVAKAPVFLLVKNDSPYQSTQDLVTAAKSKDLNYGSPGVGSSTHLIGEMLRKQTGTRLVHIPYRGAGPALIDAVSGQLDFIFDVLIGSRGYLDENRLRIIATADVERSKLLPKVPTLAESGIDNVSLTTWWGISARAGTDPDTVATLAKQISEVLKNPQINKNFATLGIEIQPTSPETFRQIINQNSKILEPLIKSLGIDLN